MTLAVAGDTAIQALDALNLAREGALVLSRALIRQCAITIRATHRHEWTVAEQGAAAATTNVQALRAQLAPFGALWYAGYVQDALKEYAEALLLLALVREQPLPTHQDLEIEPAPFLNGLAEAASELRRYLLDRLRVDDPAAGAAANERLLALMDDVYALLVTVDYPDAVTGGLRRTTDALRAVLERTRGDLTTSVQQAQLLRALRSPAAQSPPAPGD